VQIKISTRHGHLSEETRQFIQEKAQKLLRLFERLTMIEITVDLKDEVKKSVEFLINAEHKHDIVAHESHPDVLAAVDLCLAKAEHQLRRYKEKIQDHRRRPAAGDVTNAPSLEESPEV
jgi:putative sigma-54 modulation protein